jgi:hypothetical protein
LPAAVTGETMAHQFLADLWVKCTRFAGPGVGAGCFGNTASFSHALIQQYTITPTARTCCTDEGQITSLPDAGDRLGIGGSFVAGSFPATLNTV